MDKLKLQSLAIDGQTEKLEAEKTRLEILALRRPALFKSTFWLAAIPVILAGYGAYQVSQSEVFDITRARLELRSENLDLRNNLLLTEINKTQKNFEKQKKELEQKALLQEEEFAARFKKLNDDFEIRKRNIEKEELRLKAQTKQLETEKKSLTEQKIILESEKNDLVSTITSLKKEVEDQREFGPLKANLADLKSCTKSDKDRCGAYHDAAEYLIKLLSKTGSEKQKGFFEDTLQNEAEGAYKNILLAVKFVATKDEKYARTFLDNLFNSQAEEAKRNWYTFSTVQWHRGPNKWNFAFEVLERAWANVRENDLGEEVLRDISYPFGNAQEALPKNGFSDPELFLYAVERLRTISNDFSQPNFKVMRATASLLTLKPEAFMADVAKNILEDKYNAQLLAEIGRLISSPKGRIGKLVEEVGFPNTVIGDWASWIEENKVLVETWAHPLPNATRKKILQGNI